MAKKQNNLETILKEIKEKYGEDSIIKLGDIPKVDVGAISTGSIGLDHALGVGGVPMGRVVEIFGPESSGKTTLALHIIAEAQKKGGLCAFVDAEHALDSEYSEKLGVKVKDLMLSQPSSGEQALEITESLVRSGEVAVIVIDSVAALTPQTEIDGEMGDKHIGLQARLMSQALRKLTSVSAKSNTTIIFINQIRMNIGGYGNPETTAGGKALRFYSSVRIDIRRIAQIKKGEETIGGRIRARVVKNKVAPPFKKTEFDLIYNEGISRPSEILGLGEKFGIIKKAGASYSYGDTRLGVGYDKARIFLRENPKMSKEIVKRIKEELGN